MKIGEAWGSEFGNKLGSIIWYSDTKSSVIMASYTYRVFSADWSCYVMGNAWEISWNDFIHMYDFGIEGYNRTHKSLVVQNIRNTAMVY
jgi:hypothetical protein